jgi:hypothetical protein
MISLHPIDSSNDREAIELSVAPAFYRRNGFAETGEIGGGEIVMERQI